MILWRLSIRRYARSFDGGYGLLFEGRWNSIGRAVTYAATSPALCVLEKLVHVEDPALLPPLVMVRYEVPDTLSADIVDLAHLPRDWRKNEAFTQALGDDWHRMRDTALLNVPSVIVPLRNAPDRNIVINHEHPAAKTIRIVATETFVLDPRLL